MESHDHCGNKDQEKLATGITHAILLEVIKQARKLERLERLELHASLRAPIVKPLLTPTDSGLPKSLKYLVVKNLNFQVIRTFFPVASQPVKLHIELGSWGNTSAIQAYRGFELSQMPNLQDLSSVNYPLPLAEIFLRPATQLKTLSVRPISDTTTFSSGTMAFVR